MKGVQKSIAQQGVVGIKGASLKGRTVEVGVAETNRVKLSQRTKKLLQNLVNENLSERSAKFEVRSGWDRIVRAIKHWFSSKFDVFYSEDESFNRRISRSRESFSNAIVDTLKAMSNNDIDGMKEALDEMNQALSVMNFDKDTKDALSREAVEHGLSLVSEEVLQGLYDISDETLFGVSSSRVGLILECVVSAMKAKEMSGDFLKANFRIACYNSPFQDEALVDDMKVLGSGTVNTVFLANYAGVSPQVFKAEETNIQGFTAPTSAGIPPEEPRLSQRSIASSRLDERLGFNVIVKTHPALHNGVRGIVMEKAEGLAQSGGREIITEPDQKIRAIIEELIIDNNVQFDSEGNPIGLEAKAVFAVLTKSEGIRMIDGELKIVNKGYIKINHNDPEYRKAMMRLQLEDAITGQVDRHVGNFIINVDKGEKIYGVKGIDNDYSFGSRIWNLNDIRSSTQLAGFWVVRLPHVVDTEMFDSITGLGDADIDLIMEGSFTKDEVDAAKLRLLALKTHLNQLKANGNVIEPHEWGSAKASEFLAVKEPFHDGQGEQWTSYVQRDSEYIDYYSQTPGKFIVNVRGEIISE